MTPGLGSDFPPFLRLRGGWCVCVRVVSCLHLLNFAVQARSQLGKSGCKVKGRERLCRGQRPHLRTGEGNLLGQAALLPWIWVDADCSVLPPAGHMWKQHFTPSGYLRFC